MDHVSEEASKKHPFPCPTTYRTAFSHYLDITGTPRTHILRELAEYAQDQKDKDFLNKLSSSTPEGKVRVHLYSVIILFPCMSFIYTYNCGMITSCHFKNIHFTIPSLDKIRTYNMLWLSNLNCCQSLE